MPNAYQKHMRGVLQASIESKIQPKEIAYNEADRYAVYLHEDSVTVDKIPSLYMLGIASGTTGASLLGVDNAAFSFLTASELQSLMTEADTGLADHETRIAALEGGGASSIRGSANVSADYGPQTVASGSPSSLQGDWAIAVEDNITHNTSSELSFTFNGANGTVVSLVAYFAFYDTVNSGNLTFYFRKNGTTNLAESPTVSYGSDVNYSFLQCITTLNTGDVVRLSGVVGSTTNTFYIAAGTSLQVEKV